MKSNKIEPSKIYSKFALEFANSRIYSWTEFINKKDLGITPHTMALNLDLVMSYSIIDQKKWNYNKIKYELY